MLIGIAMGSESDWPVMAHAARRLDLLGVPWEAKVVSAHRTPHLLIEYAEGAEGRLDAIIAGAGGSAHLPGMLAALTVVPVCGVAIDTGFLDGLDAVLSMIRMPAGTPLAFAGIGTAGAVNAALLVARLAAILGDEGVAGRLDSCRRQEADRVLAAELPPPATTEFSTETGGP